MTNRRRHGRAFRSRVASVLAVVTLTCAVLATTAVASSPAGAATCNPLMQLLRMCTAPAPTTPAYISMEDGLPASLLDPDPCTPDLQAAGQCRPTHLDPAYTPALSIPAEPSSTVPSAPARPGAACGGVHPAKADGAAWRCTFSDEFSATALDRSKWTPQLTQQTGFTTGSGAATACYVDSPNNVRVRGGALELTVRKEAAPVSCSAGQSVFTTNFTAGGVSSIGSFSQTYGRFDVRAAFPAAVLQGLQSSLWLWPDESMKYGPWPASGEIDLAEYYTVRPGFVVPTFHYYADPLQQETAKGINTTSQSFCHFDEPASFHDYTLIWGPDLLSVYYDGTLCLFDHWRPALMTAPTPFDSPFFMALTAGLGVGSNYYDVWRTKLPATTKVDYVRIWK
jgi:beta-glucanase (GH16 family)